LHSTPAQLSDLLEYIGFDWRRKLIGEIGDD